MLVFWTEYLAISFPQACRPAFCTALCKIYQFGFYQVVTAYINHLVSHANLCDLWQWKTDNLEPLPFPDDGFQKAQRRRLGIFRFPFGNIFGLNCCSLAPSMPFLVLLPLSAIQTKTSLPGSGSFWSSKSPQHSFRVSCLARKPKWREKNHHNVHQVLRDCGNQIHRSQISFTLLLLLIHFFGLFPRPFFTKFFSLAANTSLKWRNSSSWMISKGSFNPLK